MRCAAPCAHVSACVRQVHTCMHACVHAGTRHYEYACARPCTFTSAPLTLMDAQDMAAGAAMNRPMGMMDGPMARMGHGGAFEGGPMMGGAWADEFGSRIRVRALYVCRQSEMRCNVTLNPPKPYTLNPHLNPKP